MKETSTKVNDVKDAEEEILINHLLELKLNKYDGQKAFLKFKKLIKKK